MGQRAKSTRSALWLFATVLVVLYNDWLFGPLLNPHMSLNRSLISELSARTQPHHWAFQAMDISVGVLSLAAVPRVWRFVGRGKRWYARLLPVCFGLIGLDSIIDASLPISCAPSVDAHCSLAGVQSLSTEAHMVESTLIGIVTFIAPLLWWRWHQRRHQFLARASLWFAGLQVAVGAAILGTRLVDVTVVGALQRGYQLGIGLWMGIIVVTAHKRRRLPAANIDESAALEPQIQPLLQPELTEN